MRPWGRFLQGVGEEQRQTVGARFWRNSTPAHPFGYNTELIGQFGRFGPGQIRAYYASGIVSCQVPRWPLTPDFRVATDAISGDQGRGAAGLQTFNALFARPFFGNAIAPSARAICSTCTLAWSCTCAPA
ncbi:alginate export family protein [Hymenobacter daeguensis]